MGESESWGIQVLYGLGIGFITGGVAILGYQIGKSFGAYEVFSKVGTEINSALKQVSSDAAKSINAFKDLGAERLNANDFTSVVLDASHIDPSKYLVDGNFVFELADMYKLFGIGA